MTEPSASGTSEPVEARPARPQAQARPLRRRARAWLWVSVRSIRQHGAAATLPPPATRPLGQVLYGIAQPLLGVRIALRDRALLRLAAWPVATFAIVCACVAAEAGDGTWWGATVAFAATLVALAPVPPVLFARSYARISARAHELLGFGPASPWPRSLTSSGVEALMQIVVVALALGPVAVVVGWVPLLGPLAMIVLQATWALYWIVLDALDSARVLPTGTMASDVPAVAEAPWWMLPPPGFRHGPGRVLWTPLRAWGGFVARLSRPWSREIAMSARYPWVVAGFAVGTGLILAIPGINLLFRPGVVVGASHLLGRLEPPARAPEVPSVSAAVGEAPGS